MTTVKPSPKTRAKVTTAKTSKVAAGPKPTNPKPAAPKRPAAAPRKQAAKPAPKPASQPSAPGEASTAKPRHKLVRDSFTIPKSEYQVLDALKLRAAKLARPTKKSEVLRAGIGALHAMSDKTFLAALGAIPSIKTGRPKGSRQGKPEAK